MSITLDEGSNFITVFYNMYNKCQYKKLNSADGKLGTKFLYEVSF